MPDARQAAAEAAAQWVRDGMVVGLGSGNSAALVIETIGRRVRDEKLRIRGVPTSDASAELAGLARIPLTTLEENPRVHLTIDGADEVERGTLNLIKGKGGALLHEKIVAAASDRLLIVVDGSKLVDRLGEHRTLPVEVIPFGWKTTAERLAKLGLAPKIRAGLVTDSGHYILDCSFTELPDPAALENIVGVVDHGLFLGMASAVLVGHADGTVTHIGEPPSG